MSSQVNRRSTGLGMSVSGTMVPVRFRCRLVFVLPYKKGLPVDSMNSIAHGTNNLIGTGRS